VDGETVGLRSWGAFGSVEVMTRSEAVSRGDVDDDDD
jgi:hypothetical protein